MIKLYIYDEKWLGSLVGGQLNDLDFGISGDMETCQTFYSPLASWASPYF